MDENKRQRKRKRIPSKYQPGFLARMDARCELTQILSSAFDEICVDCGGKESLSHTKLTLIERFVFLEYVLRQWEVRIANNPKKTASLVSRWVQGLNSLTGLARTIGLERRAKKIESLESYVLEQSKNGKRKRRKQTG